MDQVTQQNAALVEQASRGFGRHGRPGPRAVRNHGPLFIDAFGNGDVMAHQPECGAGRGRTVERVSRAMISHMSRSFMDLPLMCLAARGGPAIPGMR